MPQVAVRALALLLASSSLAAPAWAERIFISNEKGNSITVVDAESLKVARTVRVGERPRGIE